MNILDVIAPDRTRYAGMSDDALDDEHDAQSTLKRAIKDMENVFEMLERVNRDSSLVKINVQAFRDVMSDELPSFLTWDERIAEARRG